LPSDDLPVPSFPASDEHARPPRKNLLLAASVEAGALSAPVRIRNLSETGALIDGAALPEIGTELTLRRMEIEIGATVMWRTGGRCGIRFAGNVSVDDWVIGKRRTSALFERSQAGVDARQAAVRSGVSLPAEDGAATITLPRADVLEERIAEELAYLRRVLDSVGDVLSDDAIILQRHSGALQQIDVACQTLAELGAILGSMDRVAAASAVNMHDLRARLLRK
jgi:hypothetical protein